MRRLLLLFFILPIVHCDCPDGFKLYAGGQCELITPYTVSSLRNDQATDTAITKCKEKHAQPIIIHYAEQNSYWAGKYSSYAQPLGLVCNTSSLKWQWSDDSALDYKPSAGYSSALNSNCYTGAVWYIARTDGYWFVASGSSTSSFNVYCTIQLPQPIYSEDGCEYFNDDSEDGVCYRVGEDAETWQEAQLNCKKVGANLASVHNQQENNYLRRLSVSQNAITGLFLGATISGKENNFGWIDGTPWDYQNFYPGFPLPGFGDCVAMDTSSTAGLWMNFDCNSKLPVACIRDKMTNLVANYTCSAGPWEEDTLITSPGFPYNASTPCEFFLMADDGKHVELEILHLEANPCCDNLVLYDGYISGSKIATVTGIHTNVTYTTTQTNFMRVSWEPKGGYNVMGLAMTFRSV